MPGRAAPPARASHAAAALATAAALRRSCNPTPAAVQPNRVQGDAAEGEQKLGLHRSFTHAAHKGVVKCVAAAGQWGATGGADDLIHLYDLKVRATERCERPS